MKKKSMMPLSKIAGIIILLFFAVLFILAFLAPSGLLNKAAEQAEIFKRFIPGREELGPRPETTVSEELKTDFNAFCDAIKKYKTSEKCLINYPLFSSLKKDYSIKIVYADEGFFAQLINAKGQVEDSCVIEGIKPCVVAGKNKAAVNFYENYLRDRNNPCTGNCASPEFTEPTSITVKWGGTDYNEKSIHVLYKDGSKLNSDMEDANVLYKPDKGHVCFFPTFDGDFWCNGNIKGLDDDCLQDEDENVQGVISQCGSS